MHRTRNARLGALAISAALVFTMVGVGQAAELPASPGEPPEEVDTLTGTAGEAAPPEARDAVAPTQTSDDDSEGHETEDPAPPRHASGSVAEVHLAGQELVTVGHTNAQVNDDDSSQGDVVILAIGGQEIIAAHSSSTGTQQDGVGPALLCEETGGGVCVGLLYADTESRETATSSSSTADTALVYACVGGTQEQPEADCDGVVGAGVSEAHSSIQKNKTSGSMQAEQQTDLADVCLGGEVNGVCSGLGLSVIHAESRSSAGSTDAPGSTERSSHVVALEAGGEQVVVIDEPTAIAIPPGCPDDPGSLLCIFLNQGESFVFVGGAGSRQEAVHIDVLRSTSVPGQDLVLAHLGTAETLVEAQAPEVIPTNGPPPTVIPRDGLPVTGTAALPLLILAITLGGLGAGLLLAGNRARLALG